MLLLIMLNNRQMDALDKFVFAPECHPAFDIAVKLENYSGPRPNLVRTSSSTGVVRVFWSLCSSFRMMFCFDFRFSLRHLLIPYSIPFCSILPTSGQRARGSPRVPLVAWKKVTPWRDNPDSLIVNGTVSLVVFIHVVHPIHHAHIHIFLFVCTLFYRLQEGVQHVSQYPLHDLLRSGQPWNS